MISEGFPEKRGVCPWRFLLEGLGGKRKRGGGLEVEGRVFAPNSVVLG